MAYDDHRDHTTRSIFAFGLSGVAGRPVWEAHLDLVNIHSSSCTPTTTSLYISGPLNSDATWNNQPATMSGPLDSKTFAHRNDAACPIATEGFNATAAVQTAQAQGWSDITMKLQADNESSNLSWKKFNSNPLLTMSYNSFPAGVSGLGVSGCALTCSPVPYTRSSTPTFTATASDPDGDNLTVDFEVWQGGTLLTAGTSATVASGGQASKSLGPLGDGSYTFRARARDAPGAYGPWSANTSFVIDTVMPAAPTLTAAMTAGPVTPDDGPVIGETTWSVTISGSTNDHAKGYVYAAAPAGVVTAPPGNLSCDQRSGYYVVMCPASVGDPVTVTVAAPAAASTVTAWTFDAAGNVNGSSSRWGPAASVDLKIVQTPPAPTLVPASSARVPSGHLWDSDSLPVDGNGDPTEACASHQVVDQTRPSVTPHPLALTSSGACWVYDEARGNPVLTFNGSTGGAVADRDPVIDTANSFSVGAWVNAASTTGSRTFLGQYSSAGGANPAYRSVFYLQARDGQWRFCVALAAAAGSGQDCAAVNGAVANAWTFVTGGYDKINRRVWVRTAGNPVAVEPHTASTPTAQGPVTVGHVLQEGNWFSGRVYRPFLVPGVLSDNQAADIADNVLLPDINGADQLPRPLMDGQLVGSLESVRQGPGGVRVEGWAIDGDTQAPADIHVYVDGTGFNLGAAAAPRADIAAQYPWYGGNHGFATTPAYSGANGTKSVCVYGINTAGAGGNVLLGCPSIGFSNDPHGSFDHASFTSGQLKVIGWSIDPNVDTSTDVHFYTDGAWTGAVTANASRPDVAAAFPGYSSLHGFDASLPASFSPGSHSVCAYGINAGGTPGTNNLIMCRTFTV